MISGKVNQRIDQRTGKPADHEHLFLSKAAAKPFGIQLCNQLRDKRNGDRNHKDHGISVEIIGGVGAERTAGLKAAEDQGAQQDDGHILVRFDTLKHIPERVMLCFLFVFGIFQLDIVLFYLCCQRQHHNKEDHGGNDRDGTHGKANVLADEEHPDDTGENRKDTGQNPLELQNAVAFIDIVGQRNDHGVHRNLYERIGQVVEQICNHEPADFQRVRRLLRHQEENHGKDREKEKRCAVPRQIFSLSGQLSQQSAVPDVQLVDQESKDHIVAGVNDFDD